MMNLLFNVFIFPIEQILSFSFTIVYRVFKTPSMSGIAILGVSFIFSIITLPLYFLAEKFQHKERQVQARMKSEIDNIKAVFFGNERFMRLTTYYRHIGYNPIYSLRSSLSVLIQVPFFIAAYHFLSNLETIRGVHFGPIMDLMKSDSLVNIGGIPINVLPIIMTLINITSGAIYTRGFPKRDKFQLYGMALIFLALLYNSPAALVIYWTCNNIFSLTKNIILKMKHSGRVILVIVSVICFSAAFFILFKGDMTMIKRYIMVFTLFIIPFVIFIFQRLVKSRRNQTSSIEEKNIFEGINIFVLSIIVIFLLGGLVIPSSLISSSVQEFSFIENNTSPIPFILNVLSQAFGLFILLPLCIYFLLGKNGKVVATKIAFVLSGICIVNVFAFPGDYGPITVLFIFSKTLISGTAITLINLLIIAAVIFIFLYIFKFKKLIFSILTILVFTFTVMGGMNCFNIVRSFNALEKQLQYEKAKTGDYEKVYKFSKNGKNVVVILLDKAVGGLVHYLFDEKPELLKSFDGFTWYRNTVSFSATTIFGIAGVYGGYEYSPTGMQSRDDTAMVTKHNEALLLLPKIFMDKGFKVTVTDPPFANYSWVPDLSIYQDYPDIYADNIIGKYTQTWLSEEENKVDLVNITDVIKLCLIRFSIFKFVPLQFRDFIYDFGRWFYMGFSSIPLIYLDHYIALDVLNNTTEILENDTNTFNSIYNCLTHDPWILSYPDYKPSNEINSKGSGPFAEEGYYHVNMASMLLLAKWFDFLKNNDAYDNTRIIITSDHGYDITWYFEYPENLDLPDGFGVQTFAPFLLFKDFDSHGTLLTDNNFMTNADVPLLALKDIVPNPVNPWTGKLLVPDKENGVDITTRLYQMNIPNKNTFDIGRNEWLHVHDNMYDINNWTRVSK